ncbi:helix-loop-helix DNA-binding domain-containing protein [Phlyctema vagabunda]|uniref:Helix-loop-helix DNA-binding domain-containing protein n=1 Tax=Phlyctema vagabunda TaxID=108571 RepID=A0ABR4P1R7_9HELO
MSSTTTFTTTSLSRPKTKTQSVDYFSLSSQKAQNIVTVQPRSTSPFRFWSTAEEELESPEESASDSFLTTPTSRSPSPHPTYHLPQSPAAVQKTVEPAPVSALDNFGTVEDWMCWDSCGSIDDACEKALSPTSEYFPELKLEPTSPSPIMSSVNPRSMSLNNDDSALFNGGGAQEHLYSTPLSWTRPVLPQPRQHQQLQPLFTTTLSPGEESKLRSIAMPSNSMPIYPGSPTQSEMSSPSMEPESMSMRPRKRKNSTDDDEADDDDEDRHRDHLREPLRKQPIKKTAHNMIEKRYRTNLNDKIAALRDSVPSLRVMVKKNSRGEEIEEDLQGLTPAHKLNKATVLSKATEYIAHLEKRNKHMARENTQLKARVEAFEILMLSQQSTQQQQMQQQQQQQQRQSGYGMMR